VTRFATVSGSVISGFHNHEVNGDRPRRKSVRGRGWSGLVCRPTLCAIKRCHYNFCISQGSAATVLTQVAKTAVICVKLFSGCNPLKLVKSIGQCFPELLEK